jgi:hypothetical protein
MFPPKSYVIDKNWFKLTHVSAELATWELGYWKVCCLNLPPPKSYVIENNFINTCLVRLKVTSLRITDLTYLEVMLLKSPFFKLASTLTHIFKTNWMNAPSPPKSYLIENSWFKLATYSSWTRIVKKTE